MITLPECNAEIKRKEIRPSKFMEWAHTISTGLDLAKFDVEYFFKGMKESAMKLYRKVRWWHTPDEPRNPRRYPEMGEYYERIETEMRHFSCIGCDTPLFNSANKTMMNPNYIYFNHARKFVDVKESETHPGTKFLF